MSREPASRIVLGLGAIAAGLTAGASADVVHSTWSNSSYYHYEIIHMPDFDQRRLGDLLVDGGSHCVPTSTMNLIGYAINHGFANDLDPGGPHWWQGQIWYDTITDEIDDLGVIMDTDEGGTDFGGLADGLDATFGVSGKFTYETYLAANNWAPRMHNLAEWAIDGGIVSFCYGRWEINGTYTFNDVELPQLDRDGGHCVTFTQAVTTGDNNYIGYRDPADDPANTSQSTFVTTQFDMKDLTYAISFSDAGVMQLSRFEIDPPPSDGKLRLIDGACVINTKQGYVFTPKTLEKLDPHGPSGLTSIPHPTHGGPPSDFAVAPGGGAILLLYPGLASPSAIYRLHAANGEDELVASVGTGTRFVVGRCLDLYVLTPTSLDCYRFDPADETYDLLTSAALPCGGDAIFYDDATDEVVVLCCDAGSILRYPKSLATGPATSAVPSSVPLGAPCAIAVNPEDGRVWIATSADPDALYEIDGATANALPLPADQPTPCVSFDDGGHLFTTTANGIAEFMRDPTWQQIDSAYDDVPLVGCLRMRRSRTNWDPTGAHADPGWSVNLDPDELVQGRIVPDCNADLDADGQVALSDLLLVLSNWGLDHPIADYMPEGGDGAVNLPDLLDVLSNWGPCPAAQ